MASYRERNGSWQYRISYKNLDGEYKEKSKSKFRTKKEAQIAAGKAERQIQKQLETNSLTDRDVSFRDYFIKWYELYKGPHVTPVTMKTYRTTSRIVATYFQDTPLSKISIDRYQLFINEYGENHSLRSVRKAHSQLKACIQYALHTGHIMTDITFKVKMTGTAVQDENKKFLDEVDAKKLIATITKDYDGSQTADAMILFALATGCRLGEVFAITEDCLDWKKKTVKIKRSWDYSDTHNFIKTKTESSVRTIAVDKETLVVLDTIIKHYKKLALKIGVRKYNKFVFVTRLFKQMSYRRVNEILKEKCVEAGIKVITFHSLRHTHASLLLLKGSDIHFVSKRLGHSSALVTAEVYAHVLKEMEDKGNEQVEFLASEIYK